MSTEEPSKINRLLLSNPYGVVFLSKWLSEQGYSLELQRRYRNSQWLKSIGDGAMIRSSDNVGYEGAIYALQQQAQTHIHPGGKTAFSLLGKTHYLGLGKSPVYLFGGAKETLPTWFKKHDWNADIHYHSSSFLPPETGLADFEVKNFSIKISGPARAMMECLYLSPKDQSLVECYELMEGLNNLRPNLVQALLEECTSIKVKRLFLYLADKAGHSWLNYLNLEKVELGNGKRSLVSNGVYVSKYQITVPKELEDNGIPSI